MLGTEGQAGLMGQEIPADYSDQAVEFEAAFNRIDVALRRATGNFDRDRFSFGSLLDAYEKQHKGFGAALSRLRDYARLRNAMVHERIEPGKYFAYPTLETVTDILLVERQLTAPQRADQMFLRSVEWVLPTTSVLALLDLIHKNDFTQFPVYSRQWDFIGLVTSNGLSRWFASRPGLSTPLVDLSGHLVDELLKREESRSNTLFMARGVPVVDVVQAFRDNAFLEAVIFTHDGDQEQSPIGIATQWDIANKDLGST